MSYTREVKKDTRDIKEEQNEAHFNYSAYFMEKSLTAWERGDCLGDRRNPNRKPSCSWLYPFGQETHHTSLPASSPLLPTSLVTYIIQDA